MNYQSLFVGSEALALTLVMLTMKQDFVSWRFRLSGSKNRNVGHYDSVVTYSDVAQSGSSTAPGGMMLVQIQPSEPVVGQLPTDVGDYRLTLQRIIMLAENCGIVRYTWRFMNGTMTPK